MVVSKSEHIKYRDLCPKCRDNARLEGRIWVKKLCHDCKKTYWKNADKKKRYGEAPNTKYRNYALDNSLKTIKRNLKSEYKVLSEKISKEKSIAKKLARKLKGIEIYSEQRDKIKLQIEKINNVLDTK